MVEFCVDYGMFVVVIMSVFVGFIFVVFGVVYYYGVFIECEYGFIVFVGLVMNLLFFVVFVLVFVVGVFVGFDVI